MPALRASTLAASILPAEEVDCHLALAGRDLQIAFAGCDLKTYLTNNDLMHCHSRIVSNH